MKKSLPLLIFAALIVGWSANALFAQERGDREGREGREGRRSRSEDGGGRFGGGPPGGFGGGPGFGGPFGGGPGGPGGRGDDASRNERRIAMLKAMDTNGDGKLEPSEIPEYRRNFVSMIVNQMGGDPTKTIVLADLERKAAANAGSSQAQGGRSGSTSSSSTGISLSKDPLVPYFGEKEPTLPAVVAFGQREPAPKSTGSAGSASGVALSQSDQLMRTAREIMNRYDKNKNGTLDKDKGEWSPSLPFNPETADKNHDGRISMSELVAALGGKSSGTLGSGVVSTKQSNAYDRLPIGVPDWFFERDKNQDGQLSMQEYANGQPWTDAIAEEFTFLDTNNDGYATVAEVFAALKKVDDEKRLKEEQAKRELQRRQGAGSSTVAVSTTPTGETPPNPETPGVPDSPPGSPPPPGAPHGSETTAAPATETPSPIPSAPAEAGPNWKPQPGDAPPAPKAIPQSAPYSSGSDSNSKTYSRDKDRERKEYRRPSQYRNTGR